MQLSLWSFVSVLPRKNEYSCTSPRKTIGNEWLARLMQKLGEPDNRTMHIKHTHVTDGVITETSLKDPKLELCEGQEIIIKGKKPSGRQPGLTGQPQRIKLRLH